MVTDEKELKAIDIKLGNFTENITYVGETPFTNKEMNPIYKYGRWYWMYDAIYKDILNMGRSLATTGLRYGVIIDVPEAVARNRNSKKEFILSKIKEEHPEAYEAIEEEKSHKQLKGIYD